MKKNKIIKDLSPIYFFTFIFCLILSVSAQNLTVREIMAEPSISGMRVESERLSPDGKYVVFLWNAEGREPKDLYLISTTGGEPRKLLSPKDLLRQTPAEEKEDKLNYGLIVDDEFVKSRRNQIGNLDWSPDSKRLLFAQNGDLYILNIESYLTTGKSALLENSWKALEPIFQRQADLIPNIHSVLTRVGIQEQEIFGRIAQYRSNLINILSEKPEAENGNRSERQKQKVIQASNDFNQAVSRLFQLPENYPQLRSNETFLKLLDELQGLQNRIKVYQEDYLNLSESFSMKPRRLTKTQAAETSAQWLDHRRILYAQSGNFFVADTESFMIAQVSREANPQNAVSVSSATPTENDELIAYIVSDASKQKSIIVPTFIDDLVQAPSSRRGFSEQKILVAKSDGSLEKPIEIELPKAEGDSYFYGIEWLADNKTLIVDRVDKTHKRRQIFAAPVENDKANVFLIHEETDEKWIGGPARILEANPKKENQFFFGSEKDGWHHLYLVSLDQSKFADKKANAEIKQLTKGDWQVEWAKWSDENRILLNSTRASAAEREFYYLLPMTETLVPVESGQKGMKTNPQIADAGSAATKFIYEYSEWNKPGEIYVDESCNAKCENAPPQKLTNTAPESFLKRKWNEPQFIEIPSGDKKKIPAKIYLPANFDKKKKYPMVIFVHGAGYLQNVINGWNNYWREFLFNQLLTEKGYVVLDIDYRGSAGYGRDWRTDVYDFLGGKDYEDHLDAIDHMTANYAVDAKRVGVYGGSYGGFMAGMLVMRAPEKIAAAAALRPVFDWKNYYAANAFYTSQRLRSPKENPEGYRRSSPISYAEKLEKPLLILHGLVDSNVQAQDSFQLVEKLIRLNKTPYFESMFYPSENHAFTRATSWADEYERILTFFEKHLK